MAGTATKIVYPSNVTRLSDDSQTSILRKSGQDTQKTWNMTDIDLLNCLQDRNSDKGEVIEKLRTVLRRNGGRLPYGDQISIFQALLPILIDQSWEARHICLQLIRECIPKLGSDLKECLAVTFPRLIPNMGHAKVAIRRDVIHLIHTYMKYAGPLSDLMLALVKYGIEYHDNRIAREVIIGLPLLFTVDFSKENYFDITQSLASRLLNNNNEDNIRQHILLSLEKLRNLIGDETFIKDMRKLPLEIQRCYESLSNHIIIEKNLKGINLQINNIHRRRGNNRIKNNQDSSTDNTPTSTPRPEVFKDTTYDFGIVPSSIIRTLKEETNVRLKSIALDELQLVIKGQCELNSSAIQPHLLQFIDLLNEFLDDQNLKFKIVTLDIIATMIDTEALDMRPFLKQLVYAVTKRMDDSKTVIRQSIMKILVQLMHLLMASQVLSIICENLSHRNGRIRQETLNVIIGSLLTFPSYEFNLSNICQSIAHTLIDPKRQVRQASLETFALLAQAMGAGKLQPLVQAVDSIELCYDGDGVMAAVQARLARRQLPRLNQDRLVLYATSLAPQSAGPIRTTAQTGADIDWINSASNGSSMAGSARSYRSSTDNMELESVTSARTTPTNLSTSDSAASNYGPSPRRHPSAGKLPWEGSKKINETLAKTITKAHSQNAFLEKEDKYSRRQQSPENGADVANGISKCSATSYSEIYQRSKVKRQTQHSRPQSNMSQSWNMESGARSALLTTPRKVNTHSTSTDLSNTWPDSSLFEQEVSRSHKRFLDPISVTDSYNSEFEFDIEKKATTTPIPTKPTLVRATSSKRKVPPIAISDSPVERHRHDNHTNNRNHDNQTKNHCPDDDEDRQMANSLRQIRNSATKKKAEKLFEKLEQKHTKDYDSPNSDPDYYYDDDEYEDEEEDDDTTIYTELTSHRSMDLTKTKPQTKKIDIPFERKPRLARKNSQKFAENENKKYTEFKPIGKHSNFHHFSYIRGIGGVTFRENRNSDVAIVGRAYGDEKYEAKVQNSSQNAIQSINTVSLQNKIEGVAKRERRRFSKTVLSPLGVASMHHPGSIEMDDSKVYGGVVGKGMFETGQDAIGGGVATVSTQNNVSRRLCKDSNANEPMKSLPQGVYGVGVNQQNLADDFSSSDEDSPSQVVKISRAARERITKNKEIKSTDNESW